MTSKHTSHIRELPEDRTLKGLYCTWIDETEWKAVCSWLYGSNPAEKRRGVERVAAWRARGTIPFPVECTGDIVDCLLKDAFISGDKNSTEESQTLMFAMVITRFINGVNDYGIWQIKKHKSIHEIVKKFGIPFWLVSLRHECTHRVLPSLSTLKKGISFIYQWLWTNYWEPQYSSLPLTNVTALVQQIPTSWQECNKTKTVAHKDELTSSIYTDVIRDDLICYAKGKPLNKRIYKTLANSESNVLMSLLTDRLFLQPVAPEDYNIIIPDSSELHLFPILPSSLINSWKPLLCAIGRYSSLAKTKLVHALIAAAHSTRLECNWRNIMIGWCGVLLDMSYQLVTHYDSLPYIEVDLTDEDDIHTMRGEIQAFKLLDVIKKHPGPYSYAIVNKLLSYTTDDYKTRYQSLLELTALFTISQRTSCNGWIPLPFLDGKYDRELENFKSEVKRKSSLDSNTDQRDDDNSTVWRKAKRIDWYNCPLGCVPGQKLTPLSLDLPDLVPTELDVGVSLPFKEILPCKNLGAKDAESVPCDESRDELTTSGITELQLQIVQQEILLY